MPPHYRDPEWLAARYRDDGWTQRKIADACDVSPRTIREWMDRHGIETRDIEGENHPLYGETRDESVRERIAETVEGRDFSEETRKRMSKSHVGNEVPESVRERISRALEGREKSAETRAKMSESRLGESNPNWQGGHTHHYGPGWNPARKAVNRRDEVCQNCGADDDEARLEVHHIIRVQEFIDAPGASRSEAHDMDNLILLCRDCHMNVHHGELKFETELQHPAEKGD